MLQYKITLDAGHFSTKEVQSITKYLNADFNMDKTEWELEWIYANPSIYMKMTRVRPAASLEHDVLLSIVFQASCNQSPAWVTLTHCLHLPCPVHLTELKRFIYHGQL